MSKLELKMVYIEYSKERETIVPYWWHISEILKLNSKVFMELDGKNIYLGNFNKKTFVVICLKLLSFLVRKSSVKNQGLSQWMNSESESIVNEMIYQDKRTKVIIDFFKSDEYFFHL